MKKATKLMTVVLALEERAGMLRIRCPIDRGCERMGGWRKPRYAAAWHDDRRKSILLVLLCPLREGLAKDA